MYAIHPSRDHAIFLSILCQLVAVNRISEREFLTAGTPKGASHPGIVPDLWRVVVWWVDLARESWAPQRDRQH